LDVAGRSLTGAGANGRSRQQTTTHSDGRTQAWIVADRTNSRTQSGSDQRAEASVLGCRHG